MAAGAVGGAAHGGGLGMAAGHGGGAARGEDAAGWDADQVGDHAGDGDPGRASRCCDG